jgi:hypothetical protein
MRKIEMNSFEKNRVERSKTITLSRPLDQVFPLFQPEGEKSWTSSWNPQYVWPEDGVAQEGLVFTHDNGKGGNSIWTMTRFDEQNHSVEYTVVAPDSHVSQIRICCSQDLASVTSATISYTVTPISETGLGVLKQFDPAAYEQRIDGWQAAIHHFFDTGEASEVH